MTNDSSERGPPVRRLTHLLLAAFLMVLLQTARAADPVAADLIIRVGRIWTGDPARPWAEALAARGGRIVAVGTADEVARFRGPSTRFIAQPDAFAVPGLIDAHAHLTDLGAELEQVDLRGVSRLKDVARRVRAHM